MEQSPGGQAAEITRLILQHRTVLFGTILSQTADYAAAEDIFQNACVTICEKFREFKPGSNFRAWALEIVRFKLLTWYQGAPERRRRVQMTSEIAELMADPSIWPEEEKPFGRELAALRNCLDKVSGKSRQLALERFGKGLSCAEIARAMGWSVNSVYVALSRLKVALEKCVDLQLGAEDER